MPNREKGAIPIIAIVVGIIVLIAIVVIGGKGNINITKDGQSLLSGGTKTYENETYGYAAEYPASWTVKEGTTANPIVSFFSPKEGEDDLFLENVIVAVSDISSYNVTLTEAMDLWVSQNKADPTFSSFTVVGRETMTLFGIPAEQVTYEASGQGLDVKGRTTITLSGTDAWIFTYSAEAKSFDKFADGLDKILSSATLE